MNMHAVPQMTAAEAALIEGFGERFSRLPGDGAVTRARDDAMEALKAGLPTRRVEAWHYTDLRRLMTAVPAYDAEAQAPECAALLPGSAVAALANGHAGTMPRLDGVDFQPVAELLGEGGLAETLTPLNGHDTIGALNAAFLSDGWSVTIGQDVKLEQPLELHNLHGGGQAHARFPVTVGAGASATIVERQTGNGAALVSSLSDVTVGAGADLTWLIVQEQPVDTTHLARFAARLGKDAKLTLYIVNAGGQLVRQEVAVTVAGAGADFQMRCVNLLGGSGHTDVTMTLDHPVEHTGSVEIVRNIVTGRATGAFQGQIRVAAQAQKTDARMACNTLLLSDDADFSAKPELEIFADDVACGHGATVTEIDHDHLFYLMSRGVPEKEARGLLVKAFVAEIIEEMDDEPLVEALEAKLEGWFAEHG